VQPPVSQPNWLQQNHPRLEPVAPNSPPTYPSQQPRTPLHELTPGSPPPPVARRGRSYRRWVRRQALLQDTDTRASTHLPTRGRRGGRGGRTRRGGRGASRSGWQGDLQRNTIYQDPVASHEGIQGGFEAIIPYPRDGRQEAVENEAIGRGYQVSEVGDFEAPREWGANTIEAQGSQVIKEEAPECGNEADEDDAMEGVTESFNTNNSTMHYTNHLLIAMREGGRARRRG
jgi:hypothetical protein